MIGQTLYRVQVDSGEVDRVIDPPTGMADDIAFADDGTMAWTAFLIGKVYVRKPNGKTIEVAHGMSGPNSLAFGKDNWLFVSESSSAMRSTRSTSGTSTSRTSSPSHG